MRRTIAALLLAGLLVAAGCGDDDDDGGGGGAATGTSESAPATPTTPTEPSPTPAGTTAVTLSDFEIDPANPKLEAGKATFAIANTGAVPHALEIEGNGLGVRLRHALEHGRHDHARGRPRGGRVRVVLPDRQPRRHGHEGHADRRGRVGLELGLLGRVVRRGPDGRRLLGY